MSFRTVVPTVQMAATMMGVSSGQGRFESDKRRTEVKNSNRANGSDSSNGVGND